ncbi:MAG TPA: phosphoenolpyruvate carboxykinase (ATP), partial [Thermoanaerobaculia bacterium]|nr:phosphoenolpyruvate carboxykinase (ATP) [Thermoanaerobaculia bacterium]
MRNVGPYISAHGIEEQGFSNAQTVYWNLPAAQLYEQAVRRGEARIALEGPLVALTGKHTGRSPGDKFTVRDGSTDGEIWWGDVNKAFDPERFNRLMARVQGYAQNRDLFVFDGYAGADPNYRLPVRVITEQAWHNLFAQNMFLHEPDGEKLKAFKPGFTVVDVGTFKADPAMDGTASPTFILLDLSRRIVLIGGTVYAGEIK